VVRSKATVALVEVAGSIGDARLRGRRFDTPVVSGFCPATSWNAITSGRGSRTETPACRGSRSAGRSARSNSARRRAGESLVFNMRGSMSVRFGT